MKGKSHLKEWYVALVFGVLIGSVLGFAGGHMFAIAAPNTATQAVPCGTYPGTLATTSGGGQFQAQSGENIINPSIAANPYEIFQKTNFWYSWSDTGQSEPVIVEGRVLGCGLVGASLDGARYAFFISTDGGGSWHPFIQSDLGGLDGNEMSGSSGGVFGATYTCLPTQNQQWCVDQGAYKLNTVIVYIHGVTYGPSATQSAIIDGSWLKVVVQVHASGDPSTEWFDMASDIAQLHSALPRLNWVSSRSDSNGYPLYAINDTATLNIDVPTVTAGSLNGTAYFLTITLENTNAALPGYDAKPITTAHSQVRFPVTASMYVPGEPNNFLAEIDSQIFVATYKAAAYVDNASYAPSLINIAWNKPFYREGDSVTINVTGAPNAITQSPIVKCYVLAFIAGTKEFDGFSQACTVTFTATAAGLLTVQARVYDAVGRGSGMGTFQETVGPAVGLCQQYPNAVECTGGPGYFKVPDYWWIATLVSLGVGLTFLVVGLWGLPKGSRYKPLFVGLGVILTLVGIALALIALINLIAFAVNKVLWFRW